MKKIQSVFEREETKYVISRDQYHALTKALKSYIEPDAFHKNTNCNIYYDTPEFELVSRSLERPLYKEKIRVRSYGVPESDADRVFLEIKKKYKGIGNKRRIAVHLKDFYHFLRTGKLQGNNPQIELEIEQFFQTYNLAPTLFIAYERFSFCGLDDPNFRLTFDLNLRSRLDRLRLEDGDDGELYFPDGKVIMEAKGLGGFPLWFVAELAKLKIRPTSFQKYGYTYQRRFNEIVNNNHKELNNVQ